MNNASIKWAIDTLLEQGYEIQSNTPDIIQDNPWSIVYRFQTNQGFIFLKQVPSALSLEPKVINEEYWEPSLQNIEKYQRSDYQVFAILTMCRTLYTLEMHNIVSKVEAAQWAIHKLDANWKLLIEQALNQNSDLNQPEEARDFVRYIINYSCNLA